MKKAEEARGWGFRVGGPLPYLSWFISRDRDSAEEECTEPYHSPIRVVLITEREYNRLKRLDK